MNVIAGYPDGTFQPEQTITRGQLTKMLSVSIQQQPLAGSGPANPTAGGRNAQEPSPTVEAKEPAGTMQP